MGSNNMHVATALQHHASHLLYVMSKYKPKSSLNSYVLVTVQKHLLELIRKSIPKFSINAKFFFFFDKDEGF